MNETLIVPNGCLELVIEGNEPKRNCFKVMRQIVASEPKKGQQIQVLMEGTGFTYNGEIYHKTNDYIYIYLY